MIINFFTPDQRLRDVKATKKFNGAGLNWLTPYFLPPSSYAGRVNNPKPLDYIC